MNAFCHAVNTTTLCPVRGNPNVIIVESWKNHFWREVLAVVRALQAEKGLQDRNFSLREWMDLRQLTISGESLLPKIAVFLSLSRI